MKTKKNIILISALIIIILAVWFVFFNKSASDDVIIKPKKGEFEVTVTTTGELQAKNSIEIRGPSEARAIGIWNMKITRLIPEGSVVKEGNFVAELDKSEIMNQIKDVELSIKKNESEFLQARLDSTLNLSAARDDMDNLKFSLRRKKAPARRIKI